MKASAEKKAQLAASAAPYTLPNSSSSTSPVPLPSSYVSYGSSGSSSSSRAPSSPLNMSHCGTASVTYAALIALAIEFADGNRLVLDDIYKFVEKHRNLVPVKSHPNWKNSVRHNLSLRPCFVKIPRHNSSGKSLSAWWTLNVSCLPKAAREAVERVRRLPESQRKTQPLDDLIREVLTTEDSNPSSPAPSSAGLASPDPTVPDSFTAQRNATPHYTLSSNVFNFSLFDTSASSSEDEFGTVPSRPYSPPPLSFGPEPVEDPFYGADFGLAIYPDHDYNKLAPLNFDSTDFFKYDQQHHQSLFSQDLFLGADY